MSKSLVLALAAVLLQPLAGFADDGEAIFVGNLKNGGKSVCATVSKAIGEGNGSQDVVRTALELGHNACTVVQCALEAGGVLQEIIAGAVEAGAGTDVVTRCAVDAGADPGEVAAILTRPEMMLSLCYFPPEGAEFLVLPEESPAAAPVWDPFPATDRWQNISPHRPRL